MEREESVLARSSPVYAIREGDIFTIAIDDRHVYVGHVICEAVAAGTQLLVYEGPHVVGQLRLLGSADETNAHAPGIVRWASAEIASLCGELGGILDPTVLRDVTDLADYAEPGIALDMLCDRTLDANAPLSAAQRNRVLTVGRAMGLDETVAFVSR